MAGSGTQGYFGDNGPAISAGLAWPLGVGVDSSGNLFIADAGNNRILRFPSPFSQSDIFPDLVIGQPNFTSKGANYNTSQVNDKGFNLSGSRAAITFDAQGNLYFKGRKKNVIVTVETTHTPRVEEGKRVRIEPVGSTFQRVLLRFGYMEMPNIPKALGVARKLGLQFDIMSTSFFLSRRTLRRAQRSGMPRWQDRLFITLARSANDATDYFQIPTGRVVEVGTQVTI